MSIRTCGGVCFAAALAALSPIAQAVIVYDDSGPTRNLSAAGLAAGEDALWDLSGRFKGYLGTPISSKYFITADHATDGTLSNVVFDAGPNAGTYTTVARYEDPDSDLEIWEISGTFNQWVEIYRDSDEVGQTATLLGRGREAGAAVTVDTGDGPELKGWKWGALDYQKSWGRNVVSGTANSGAHLSFAFDAIDDSNEGALAENDSGGGLFIYDATDGRWELAGIHHYVDGPFRETASASGEYSASIFDQGGLYEGPDGTPMDPDYALVPDMAFDVPGNSYSTRISERQDWIDSIIPEPSSALLWCCGAMGLAWRRRSR